MDDIILYWFGWMVVIVVYFFKKKSSGQRVFLYVQLLLLATFPYFVTAGSYVIPVSFGVCVVFAFYLLSVVSLSFRDVIYLWLFVVGFVGLRLAYVIAPIWFIIPSFIIHAIILYIAVILLIDLPLKQFAIMVCCYVIGQIVYTVLIGMYRLTFVMDMEIVYMLYVYYCIFAIHFICRHIVKWFMVRMRWS